MGDVATDRIHLESLVVSPSAPSDLTDQVTKHRRLIFSICNRYGLIREFEDIYQEVCIANWKVLTKKSELIRNNVAWIQCATRGVCINHLRKKNKNPLHNSSSLEIDLVSGGAEDPLSQAIYRELEELLERSIALLTFVERSALLCVRNGWTVNEMAEDWGLTRGSVYRILRRAWEKVTKSIFAGQREQGE